ncbi:MAG: hypothetical protein ACI84C_000858 [Flavobacteriales bacterium]|jgi:hypothetical protein
MIDLHLLTKIAENDAEFRKSIAQRISAKASTFINDFAVSLKKENYNSCYYKTLNFYQGVMPYCKVSFLNDIQKSLNILSHSDDPDLKKAICKSILREIGGGLGKPVSQKNDSSANATMGLAS